MSTHAFYALGKLLNINFACAPAAANERYARRQREEQMMFKRCGDAQIRHSVTGLAAAGQALDRAVMAKYGGGAASAVPGGIRKKDWDGNKIARLTARQAEKINAQMHNARRCAQVTQVRTDSTTGAFATDQARNASSQDSQTLTRTNRALREIGNSYEELVRANKDPKNILKALAPRFLEAIKMANEDYDRISANASSTLHDLKPRLDKLDAAAKARVLASMEERMWQAMFDQASSYGGYAAMLRQAGDDTNAGRYQSISNDLATRLMFGQAIPEDIG